MCELPVFPCKARGVSPAADRFDAAAATQYTVDTPMKRRARRRRDMTQRPHAEWRVPTVATLIDVCRTPHGYLPRSTVQQQHASTLRELPNRASRRCAPQLHNCAQRMAGAEVVWAETCKHWHNKSYCQLVKENHWFNLVSLTVCLFGCTLQRSINRHASIIGAPARLLSSPIPYRPTHLPAAPHAWPRLPKVNRRMQPCELLPCRAPGAGSVSDVVHCGYKVLWAHLPIVFPHHTLAT